MKKKNGFLSSVVLLSSSNDDILAGAVFYFVKNVKLFRICILFRKLLILIHCGDCDSSLFLCDITFNVRLILCYSVIL